MIDAAADPPAVTDRFWSEADRLAALRAYEILDTPPEQAFNDLCTIAAQVCRAPIAVVNLIDETRQFFKAEVGLGVREAPLDVSICQRAILHRGLFVVPDTIQDPRFACNPLVTGEPGLRFYAGAPLETPEGLPLGTICVLDFTPRPDGLTGEQSDVLQALARQTMVQLEHRRLLKILARREAEMEQIHEIAGVGGLQVELQAGFRNRRSPQYLRIHGLPPEAARESHEAWVSRIHPNDREATERHFIEAVQGHETSYRAEYRIIRPSDGEVRWIAATARIERDADGRALRLIGAHRDITQRKANEEARELLARELSHRIKNIFAVVGGLATLTARGNPAAEAYAHDFQARLQALALAHEYVRPHGLGSGPVTVKQTVQGLLRTLLAPYAEQGRDRVVVTGDDVPVGERAAASIALIMHEQATNAVKYGALSTGSGRVLVHISLASGRLTVLWQERGGPELAGAPERQGFGSRMIARSVRAQLGGEIERDWQPEGLVMCITAPTSRLAE